MLTITNHTHDNFSCQIVYIDHQVCVYGTCSICMRKAIMDWRGYRSVQERVNPIGARPYPIGDRPYPIGDASDDPSRPPYRTTER